MVIGCSFGDVVAAVENGRDRVFGFQGSDESRIEPWMACRVGLGVTTKYTKDRQ